MLGICRGTSVGNCAHEDLREAEAVVQFRYDIRHGKLHVIVSESNFMESIVGGSVGVFRREGYDLEH